MVTYSNISPFLEALGTITSNPDEVMVFKTNIRSHAHRLEVVAMLNHIEGVNECWVDIDDCDRVLRVVGTIPQSDVEEAVSSLGFSIEELNS